MSATSRAAARRTVVASVPSGHVYVRHIADERARPDDPVRLADPDPASPGRPAGSTWWPPVMLDPGWAAEADFDVFHVHFGFDACSPAQLVELAAVLRERRKPLVLTVHDLRNPHHQDPGLHDAHLDVLVPAADALITLTPGAAAAIRERWGRSAHVLPHPHVVELATAARLRSGRDRAGAFRVGLHVKSLRASMDPLRILPALVESVGGLPGAVLQVDGHRDVLDPGGARFDGELAGYLGRASRRGELDLRIHDYLSDDELWAYLARLEVSVLPYRFGTHSGWLEACRDLGTTVVAPTCGFYAQQGPVLGYVHDGDAYDERTLAEAVRTAYEDRPDLGARLQDRRSQRAAVARAHREIYDELRGCADGRRSCVSA